MCLVKEEQAHFPTASSQRGSMTGAKVPQQYHRAGAHEEILFKAKPHIGSDVLRIAVLNMRKRLLELGGEIRFGAKVTSIIISGGRCRRDRTAPRR